MITREDFKKVVKIFSCWRVDKRRGNYRLPSGNRLNNYLYRLVWELLRNNSLGFGSDGNIHAVCKRITKDTEELIMFVPFAEDEAVIKSEQNDRVRKFVDELI